MYVYYTHVIPFLKHFENFSKILNMFKFQADADLEQNLEGEMTNFNKKNLYIVEISIRSKKQKNINIYIICPFLDLKRFRVLSTSSM